jgi:4,5-dihydroxyphthalate decarboxylase
MHLVAIKKEVADQHPEAASALFNAFEQAKELACRFYDDPNWSSLAWAPQLAQEEQLIMGGDPWPNGLEQNRSNLERFIQYELDQGLIDSRLEVEDLFHPSSHHF